MLDPSGLRDNNSPSRGESGLDHAIGAVADRQHGLIGRDQLLSLGLAPHQIKYRVRVGRLNPVFRGVFAVGRRKLSKEGHWIAAVLAGGSRATLSHPSAAELWGLRSGRSVPIHVTAPSARKSRGGVIFHELALPADEVTLHDGIRVTTVSRTLFDCATILRPRQLESAMNQAELRRLFDHLSLHDLLARYPRRPGNAAIRALLAAREASVRITRSELEVQFLEFLDERGLPWPETNQRIEGFEVDCVWRGQRIAAELDGRAFHDAQQAFDSDRARHLRLSAADWRPLRITSRMLHRSRDDLDGDLRRLLGVSAATLAP